MATITDNREKHGSWRVRWTDPQGRERSKSFKRRAEANRFANKVETDKAQGNYVAPSGGKALFNERYQQWLATRVSLRQTSLARDESYATSLILPTFGQMRIGGIDHDTCQAWVSDLVERGYAPGTVQKAAQILSKILRSAVNAKVITSNPAQDLDLPKDERDEQRYLTPEQVRKLADVIEPRYRGVVLLGAFCGLRAGELFGLRAGCVDVVGRSVKVVEIATEPRGQLSFGPPKTRASRRTVPMPKNVVDELRLQLAILDPNDLLFTTPGGDPIRQSAFRQRFWEPATWAAGLAVKPEVKRPKGKRGVGTFTLHQLRHTAVAFWIAAGANPKEIAARAGHTSVVTVLDRYGHLLPKADDTVTDALDAMWDAT